MQSYNFTDKKISGFYQDIIESFISYYFLITWFMCDDWHEGEKVLTKHYGFLLHYSH